MEDYKGEDAITLAQAAGLQAAEEAKAEFDKVTKEEDAKADYTADVLAKTKIPGEPKLPKLTEDQKAGLRIIRIVKADQLTKAKISGKPLVKIADQSDAELVEEIKDTIARATKIPKTKNGSNINGVKVAPDTNVSELTVTANGFSMTPVGSTKPIVVNTGSTKDKNLLLLLI